MGFLIPIPNLGFRTYRQHSALIPSVMDLHLKIGKSLCIVQTPGSISFAHTVYDEISQQCIKYYKRIQT